MTRTMQILLWCFLVLTVGLGLLWQYYPIPDARSRLDSLPMEGVDFEGKELFLTPFEREFFSGVDVIKRAYRVGSQTLFITVLDGTFNRHVVHDPYYCFRGAGWEILTSETISIPGGKATLILMAKEEEEREALFWYSNQKNHYNSQMLYWWQTTIRRLTLGASGEEPVLIMVQALNQRSINLPSLEADFKPLFKL